MLKLASKERGGYKLGEGEAWTAEVRVEQAIGEEKYEIKLKYKGNHIADIETFSYFVEAKNNGVLNFNAEKASLDKEGIYYNKLLIENSPSSRADAELVIKLIGNDTSESIILIGK
ncbi:hypothetical protein [Bacillus sp. FJAT-26390]|uniref:hypothetical protein n=1 Tax=Bacillus sp. FJAT-26390 TaxID=1743142 RepID=UPI001147380A|nr:hypothetical protein [Bacillus sp. FJAT-26390]